MLGVSHIFNASPFINGRQLHLASNKLRPDVEGFPHCSVVISWSHENKVDPWIIIGILNTNSKCRWMRQANSWSAASLHHPLSESFGSTQQGGSSNKDVRKSSKWYVGDEADLASLCRKQDNSWPYNKTRRLRELNYLASSVDVTML